MNGKITVTVLLIVVGVVLLAVGAFAGFWAEKQIIEPKLEAAKLTLKAMGSKLVPPITAFGEIKNISGRNITLNYVSDSLTVAIKNDAKIMTISNEAGEATGQKEISFQDLKVGDFVNITLQVNQDGALDGSRVLVIPVVQR